MATNLGLIPEDDYVEDDYVEDDFTPWDVIIRDKAADEQVADEEIEDPPPKDPREIKPWRGYARSSHTRASNSARSQILKREDRDAIRATRTTIVQHYDEVCRRHGYVLSNPSLSVENKQVEDQWLDDLTAAHKLTLAAIDTYLSSFSSDARSSSKGPKSVRSTASSRVALQEAGRQAVQSKLKLDLFRKEKQLREQEDLELQRAQAELDAKKRKAEDDRVERELEAEVELQGADVFFLENLIDDPTEDTTPLPNLNQLDLNRVSTSSTQPIAPASSVPVLHDPSLPNPPPSRSGFASGFSNMIRRTVDLFTPRRPLPGSTSTLRNGPATTAPSTSSVQVPVSVNVSSSAPVVSAPIVSSSSISNSSVVRGSIPSAVFASVSSVPVSARNSIVPSNPRPSVQTSASFSIAAASVQGQSFHQALPASFQQGIPPPQGVVYSSVPSTCASVFSSQFPSSTIGNPTFAFLPGANNPGGYSGWQNAPPISNLPPMAPPGPRFLTSHQPNVVFSPDSWIRDFCIGVADPNARNSATKPPKTKLPTFDGNPKAWPLFIQSFKSQVHDTCTTDAVRLSLLRDCLSADIRDQLGEALAQPGRYGDALFDLQRRYGNPQLVCQAFTASLLKLQPFKDGDYPALRAFSATIHNAVATLKHSGYSLDLFGGATLIQLTSKLPPIIKGRWSEYSWGFQPNLPSISDFDVWLDYLSMAGYAQHVGESAFNSETPSRQPPKPSRPPGSGKDQGAQRASVFVASTETSCSFCNGNHHVESCQKFRALKVDKRLEFLVEKRLCFRCLSVGHLGSACTKVKTCKVCKATHHTLMHGAPRLNTRPSNSTPASSEPRSSPPSTSSSNVASFSTVSNSTNSGTLLPVVPAVADSNGLDTRAFVLLDPASDITLIKSWAADLLALEGPTVFRSIGTANGSAPLKPYKQVGFSLSSLEKDFNCRIEGALVVDTFDIPTRTFDVSQLFEDWPHLTSVPVRARQAGDVAIIIGADYPALHEILDQRIDRLNPRAPRAICTLFGWCITGPIAPQPHDSSSVNVFHTSLSNFHADERLDLLVKDFFQADSFGTKPGVVPPIGKDEERALAIMKNTVRHVGDRYEVGVLWKSDEPKVPYNYRAALNRLISLERRYIKDLFLKESCVKVIEGMFALNHARKLNESEIASLPKDRTGFITYHGVFNPNKPGKCRVVFDAAFKCSGVSLNSLLLKGPDYLPNLPGILIRFRQFRVPLVADIEKMFYQVLIKPEDRSAFCFLWRVPGSSGPPEICQMNVHIFGAICSPAVCSFALRQAAKDCGDCAERVCREIDDHFYVDNWLVSYPSESEAIESAKLMYSSLLRGGFKLTQWASSSPSVRSALPDPLISSLNLDLDEVHVERTLGLKWDFLNDVFLLSVKVEEPDVITKRIVLRVVSSVFDPLGFLAAVVFPAKVLLQDIWRSEADWDDPLPHTFSARFKCWLDQLSHLSDLSIPRCYFSLQEQPSSTQLHVFADASELGYGCVVYIRRQFANAVEVSVVMAKSRVSPLKFTSIPRLELCAAVLATRLATLVGTELRLRVDQVIFWSDSTTVLSWINATSFRFHVYVGNRLGEILESSSPDQWRYVRSALNPADDLTRGIPASEVSAAHRIFVGPSFLLLDSNEWPVHPCLPQPNDSDPEVRDSHFVFLTNYEPNCLDLLLNRVSNLSRLYRIVSYVLRWADRARRTCLPRTLGPLTVDELERARVLLIRKVQSDAYREEIKDITSGRSVGKSSSLVSLTPFLDDRDILCVGGRLDNASLEFETRHPAILPPFSPFTSRVIWKAHQDRAHASVDQTLQEVRLLYWVPKGRLTVKRFLNSCLLCKRRKAGPVQPMMADLPAFRVTPNLPVFANTGVDYFGPLEVKILRSRAKRWGCLFTCLATRAVHIEMAYSLDTDSFILCLNRFESRFGVPLAYYSDNGTNFVGASNELSKCLLELDQAKIVETLSIRRVKWYFNPPAAPHFGGVWERMVRSAKTALTSILNGQTPTDEILSTSFLLVSRLLNDRPLTSVGDDPRDPLPLTPNHFILGRANSGYILHQVDPSDLCSKKRWLRTQAILDHFWHRWLREFLPNLTSRRKWFHEGRNLRVGDIVTIISANTPRGTWPLGRIFKVVTGADGIVRSAWIWSRGTEVHRPAVDLCLIAPSDPKDSALSNDSGSP